MHIPRNNWLADFQPKHGISSLGVVGLNLPPDLKDSIVEISKNNMLAEISAQCQVWNTPYFWFSAYNTEFHLGGGGFEPPPDFKVWMAKIWKK